MALLFDNPTDMEPLLPEDRDGSLLALASRLAAGAARLENAFRPHTRSQVAKLVRSMNGYYSNLIEGYRTKPHDIERALRKDFSEKKDVREKQLLHVAHVEAQQAMEQLNLAPAELLTVESICRIHKELYSRLPDEMRFIENPRGGRIEVIVWFGFTRLRMAMVALPAFSPTFGSRAREAAVRDFGPWRAAWRAGLPATGRHSTAPMKSG